jgi:TonB family protein
MSGLASLFLSGVMAATSRTQLPWFEMDDYPVWAFERKQEGPTTFELLVDPSGKPANCAILQSSGSSTLDRQACHVAMCKGRFSAALDAKGAPVYGTYRSKITWALDPDKWAQYEAGPDVEVNVSQLPSGTSEPVDVKFAYVIDASGRASECTSMGPTHTPFLDSLGCKQVAVHAQRSPSTAKVASAAVVQTAWIRFAPAQ